MAAGTTDQFVAYITALNTLSQQYGALPNNSSAMVDQNRRVMEYLRHPDYDDRLWTQLLGNESDTGFIAYVGKQSATTPMTPIATFPAPSSPGPVSIRVPHWGATLNGVFVLGFPAAGGSPIGRGDVAGWGGDWITFYGEWLRDYRSQKDGYAYCQAHLFHDGTTFKMQDLLEDVDAFNIGMTLRAQPSMSVADAVSKYYSGAAAPCKTRMKDFCTGRYGGALAADGTIDPTAGATTAKMAIAMLTDMSDKVITFGRTFKIQQVRQGGTANVISAGVGPWLVGLVMDPNADEVVRFCSGYRDILLGLVQKEATGKPVQP